MYCDFFGLEVPPFNNTPDPRFFFGTPDYEEALASLVYAAKARKGFVLVTGEVGAGKTLLTRLLVRRLQREADTAVINHTNLTWRDFLASICRQFGLEISSQDSMVELCGSLERFLVDAYHQQRLAVLIIDEAQNLPVESFEQLRMISNLEAEDAKLIQIMILGQPELQQTFQRPELEQLKQRLFRTFHLSGLTQQQAADYIHHRLAIAGRTQADGVFDDCAIERIYEHSHGIPRTINQLCDNAMLSAYAQSKTRITPEIIEEVLAEMLSLSGSAGPARSPKAALHEPTFAGAAAPPVPPPSHPPVSPCPEAAFPHSWMPSAAWPYVYPHPQESLEELKQQRMAADRVVEHLATLLERSEEVIRRFEDVCTALPKDIERLEQAHEQVVHTCQDASEQGAILGRQAQRTGELVQVVHQVTDQADAHGAGLAQQVERTGKLVQVMQQIFDEAEEHGARLSQEAQRTGRLVQVVRQIFDQADDRLGELQEAVSEAAPLCLAIPAEADRLAGMMRAHKAALQHVPTVSKDMQQLIRAGQNQAEHLQSIIAQTRRMQDPQSPPDRCRCPSQPGQPHGRQPGSAYAASAGNRLTLPPTDSCFYRRYFARLPGCALYLLFANSILIPAFSSSLRSRNTVRRLTPDFRTRASKLSGWRASNWTSLTRRAMGLDAAWFDATTDLATFANSGDDLNSP